MSGSLGPRQWAAGGILPAVALCLALLVAAGCSGSPGANGEGTVANGGGSNGDAAGQPSQTELEGDGELGEVTDYASLIANLRAQGLDVTESDAVEQPFWSEPGRTVLIGDQSIQVFEFADVATADARAAEVSQSGGSVGGTQIMWVVPPHFYRGGRVIVIYLGSHPGVRQALDMAMGPQFAGM